MFLVYSLFALTTAFTALYEIMHPVMQERQMDKPSLEHPWLMYLIFFCIALLSAPLIFFSCIIPAWGERFRVQLSKTLFEIQ